MNCSDGNQIHSAFVWPITTMQASLTSQATSRPSTRAAQSLPHQKKLLANVINTVLEMVDKDDFLEECEGDKKLVFQWSPEISRL